jgi:hypothetical protein
VSKRDGNLHGFCSSKELADQQLKLLVDDFQRKERADLIVKKDTGRFSRIHVSPGSKKNASTRNSDYAQFYNWPSYAALDFEIRYKRKGIDGACLATFMGELTTALAVFQALNANQENSDISAWIEHKSSYPTVCIREHVVQDAVIPTDAWERNSSPLDDLPGVEKI